MLKFLFLFIGGGTGALSRYILTLFVNRTLISELPFGTIIVNLLGSFLIGVLFGLTELKPIPPELKAFVFLGFLGGFTTFSTFMLESLNLLRGKELGLAFINIILSNIAGLVLVFGGYFISHLVIEKVKL